MNNSVTVASVFRKDEFFNTTQPETLSLLETHKNKDLLSEKLTGKKTSKELESICVQLYEEKDIMIGFSVRVYAALNNLWWVVEAEMSSGGDFYNRDRPSGFEGACGMHYDWSYTYVHKRDSLWVGSYGHAVYVQSEEPDYVMCTYKKVSQMGLNKIMETISVPKKSFDEEFMYFKKDSFMWYVTSLDFREKFTRFEPDVLEEINDTSSETGKCIKACSDYAGEYSVTSLLYTKTPVTTNTLELIHAGDSGYVYAAPTFQISYLFSSDFRLKSGEKTAMIYSGKVYGSLENISQLCFSFNKDIAKDFFDKETIPVTCPDEIMPLFEGAWAKGGFCDTIAPMNTRFLSEASHVIVYTPK